MSKRRKVLVVVIFFVVLVFLSITIGVIKWSSGTKNVLNYQNDTLLRDEKSNVYGSITQTKEFNTTRVIYRFKHKAPDAGKQYNGWLLSPDKGSTKFAGEFYLAGNDEYTLIFSTQDGETKYSYMVVSMDEGVPEKPSKIILGGGI